MKQLSIIRLYYLRKENGLKTLFRSNSRSFIKEILVLILLLCTLLIPTGFMLKFIHTKEIIQSIINGGINYDAFREMCLDETDIEKSEECITRVLKRNPQLIGKEYMDSVGYLTFSMMASSFDLIHNKLVDEWCFLRGINEVAATESFQELYQYYKAIISDLTYFPVPRTDVAEVYYENGWNSLRTYGGNRRHEGTDLMASNNQRGFFPVLSITDGRVEKMGWLEKGGYRIGIRSKSGGYFYYAHLSSYAPQLQEGDEVIAGQLLGFMGDSGYGEEGTVGKFDVHLHLGVYVDSKLGEMSVNPYWLLKYLEKNRTHYYYSPDN